MYDTDQEANQKLAQSVILYDGRPVFIQQCINLNLLGWFLPLKGEVNFTANLPIQDPKWRFSRIRLGYVNMADRSVFLARQPIRRSRQGICRDNLISCETVEKGFTNVTPDQFSRLIRIPEFVNTLKGTFPAFQECFEGVVRGGGRVSMAFSRGFCIERDDFDLAFIRHNAQRVAVSYDKSRTFNLPREFLHLRESLLENGASLRP